MKKNENGYLLLEFIFMSTILFLISIFMIELVRICAYKNILKSELDEITKEISNESIIFYRELKDKNKSEYLVKKLQNKYSLLLETRLSESIFKISLDKKKQEDLYILESRKSHFLKITLNNSHNFGFSVDLYACLPVLFASVLKLYSPNLEIGNKVKNTENENRLCFGQYASKSNLLPIFWHKIKLRTFSPWPVNNQIYYNGIVLPRNFKYINLYTNEVKNSLILDKINSKYFD